MTVLITGATGLVGKEIVKLCHSKGWMVHYLTSSKSKLKQEAQLKGFYWDVATGQIDLSCFEGVSVVIHLAGATISKRWTSSYKQEILDSRVKSTRLLKEVISQNNIELKHFISASAIGIYPSSQTHYYDEEFSDIAESFLGEVVKEWEGAVDELKHADLMISKVRIGLVLANEGGALPEIVKPVKVGLGAAFGSGEQWQSWIHIEDLAAIFVFLMEEGLEGVFNAVAPNPVSNSELTKAVAETLNKPLFLPNVPKWAMQLILGDMSMLLFESQRVCSQKLAEEGFQFQYPNLRPALENLL
jgi:uncharacterized protein (TIGR01777 family)